MAVLRYPLATEKAVSLIDRHNIITYVADIRASKPEIKKEFETMFGVKVERISVVRLPTNVKKVYIKISKGFKASDVATKLKLV